MQSMSALLHHDLAAALPELRQFNSTPQLTASPIYRRLEPQIRRVLDAVVTYPQTSHAPASRGTRTFL